MECHACGAELDPREKFCSKCGAVTERGKGASELAGRYVAELADGFEKLLAAALGYVANPENRTKVAVGGGIALILLFSLTSIPISRGVGGLFEPDPKGPTFSEDGTPNFADYEDVFLGEEGSYLVTGQANIRDFPTSQGTGVIGALVEGETVMAREVQAFDPGSQWLKLTDGGYVWGRNLSSLDRGESADAHGASEVKFADNIQGRWSDMAKCRGHETETRFEISENRVLFANSMGTLKRITKDELGREEYHIDFLSNDNESKEVLRISPNANGFTLLVDDVQFPNAPTQSFYSVEAGCRPEFMMD